MPYNKVTNDMLKTLLNYIGDTKGFKLKCEELNVSYNTVRQIIYKSGTRITTDKMSILEKHKNDIIELYKTKTRSQIAKIYNVSGGTMIKFFYKNNIKIINPYSFNKNFFFNKSDELAYFMGFCVADGCICTRKYSNVLSITLHNKDRSILEQFAKWLNYNHILSRKYKERPNHSRLDLHSKIFNNYFPEWGLIPRKTYEFIAPTIDTKYFKPYLIGLLDGDGHIVYKTYNNTGYIISLICNSHFIEWVYNEIIKNGFTGKMRIISYKNKCYSRLMIEKRENVINFIKWLDIDKYYHMALKRKWERPINEIYNCLEEIKLAKTTFLYLWKMPIENVIQQLNITKDDILKLSLKYKFTYPDNNYWNIIKTTKIRIVSRIDKIPSEKELYELLWSKPVSLLTTQFGVSQSTIKSWAIWYQMPTPYRGFWKKYNAF